MVHLGIRSANYFAITFILIVASHYASIAQVNFGIIASCLCITTPLNCILMYIFFGERLTARHIQGTIVIVVGVAFITLARGQATPNYNELDMRDSETSEGIQVDNLKKREFYKLASIALALFAGCLNALRTLHAKYVCKNGRYSPMDFSIDGGLCCGVVLGAFALYYWSQANPAYTLHNIIVTLISSSL